MATCGSKNGAVGLMLDHRRVFIDVCIKGRPKGVVARTELPGRHDRLTSSKIPRMPNQLVKSGKKGGIPVLTYMKLHKTSIEHV